MKIKLLGPTNQKQTKLSWSKINVCANMSKVLCLDKLKVKTSKFIGYLLSLNHYAYKCSWSE